MKIKIEMEIENCYDCPFKTRIYEQGYSAIECTKIGFRPDCPFLKNLSKPIDK